MASHPYIGAATAESGLVADTLLNALIERTPYVLKATETLGDLSQTSGQIVRVVHSEATGFAYYYDAADTTTPEDGISVLVDGDGRRYKVADSTDIGIASVLAQQNDPPGAPVVGDAYVVGVAPTGDWAAHAKDFAVYTERGWVFARPVVGAITLNQATGRNLQYDAIGAWGALLTGLNAGSVLPSYLEWPLGLCVEAQQNAPPGSPTAGLYYIVGVAPTGAWSGQAGKVAWYDGAAWQFIAPYVGARAYNRAINLNMTYESGAWGTPSEPLVRRVIDRTNVNFTAGNTTAASSDTLMTFTYTGAVGRRLSISFKEGGSISDPSYLGYTMEGNWATGTRRSRLYVYRDAESSPLMTLIAAPENDVPKLGAVNADQNVLNFYLFGYHDSPIVKNEGSNSIVGYVQHNRPRLPEAEIDLGFISMADTSEHTYRIKYEGQGSSGGSVGTRIFHHCRFNGTFTIREWGE